MEYTFEVEKKMFEAIKNKDYDQVKDLVSKGYDVNHQNSFGFWETMSENQDYRKIYEKLDEFKQGEGDKNTPLHAAVSYSNQEMIYQLFSLNANINVENQWKQNPADFGRSNSIKFRESATDMVMYSVNLFLNKDAINSLK